MLARPVMLWHWWLRVTAGRAAFSAPIDLYLHVVKPNMQHHQCSPRAYRAAAQPPPALRPWPYLTQLQHSCWLPAAAPCFSPLSTARVQVLTGPRAQHDAHLEAAMEDV
jgi:hypothetical protein